MEGTTKGLSRDSRVRRFTRVSGASRIRRVGKDIMSQSSHRHTHTHMNT
jgi:hypothetical protein